MRCSTDGRVSGVVVALTIFVAVLLSGAIAGAKQADILQKATGTWGWKEGPSTCEANSHTISFSADGQSMFLKHSKPTESFAGDSIKDFRYKVISQTDKYIRMVVVEPPETRRASNGEPVVWDLVLFGKDKYRWHRTDWQRDAYSQENVRCIRK